MRFEGTEPLERFTAAFGIVHGAQIWLLGGRRPVAAAAIAGDLLLATLVLTALPRLRRARPAVARFFGIALPVLAFYLMYMQTTLIDVSAVHWHDAALAALQERVVRRVPLIHSTALRAWFIFSYFSYDVLLAVGALALFVPGDAASQRSAGDAVRRMCYALAVCSVVGLLYPAMSPRFVTPQLQLEYLGGGAWSRLAVALQRGGMVTGSSFPSAHLAAVTALMWDLQSTRRALFWFLLPLVVSMAASTVLLQYHYVPDVVAGIIVGGAAIAFDRWRRPLAPASPRSMSAVQVVPVDGRRARAFYRVPAEVYGAAWPAWTPQLVSEERRLFDRSRNPSLEGTEYARWVALKGTRPVGRVAAFAPRSPNDVGYFGLFECIDDDETARALLGAAESWLATLGRRSCLGPLLINPRDQIGLLTDGFDRPAALLTPYNPPYYERLLEGAGYRVAVRLHAYAWERAMPDSRGLQALDARLTAGSSIRIRAIDASRLEAEALVIADVINRAFATAWRWTPITRGEALCLAADLRPIMDPSLCLVAEDARGLCGVALTVPDANWLLRRIGGRMWPLGWLTALRLRRRIPWARFMALAVLPDRRATSTALRLMVATHRALLAAGFEHAELSQVFDDNVPMRSLLERMGCAVVKRYAVFERDLTGGATGC